MNTFHEYNKEATLDCNAAAIQTQSTCPNIAHFIVIV